MRIASILPLTLLLAHSGFAEAPQAEWPNILFCILDDASYRTGAIRNVRLEYESDGSIKMVEHTTRPAPLEPQPEQ